MKTRIISGIVLVILLAIFGGLGGIPFRIGVCVISLIGLREFYRAFSEDFKTVHLIGYAFTLFYMIFLQQIINESNLFNVFSAIFLVVLLVYAVVGHKHNGIHDCMMTFFGFFYVTFLLSHLCLIREFTYGQYLIWIVFLCAWGCDTGAYCTGMLFGKHKLIPDLSPKKTIEGAIGGVIISTALCGIYGFVIENKFQLEYVNTVFMCLLIGFFGSILSQIGDLAASAMKRYSGVKDFGNLIPGHGGIIDRFDSIILTAPVAYYFMFLLIERF